MSFNPETTQTQTTTKKRVTSTTNNAYVYTSTSGEETKLDLKDGANTRPHARKVKGSIITSNFTQSSSIFVFEYTSEGVGALEPTEIFVPYIHFPGGYRVTASDGHCTIEKHEGYDIVKHEHGSHARKHRLVVEKSKKVAARYSWFAWTGHSNIPVYVALGIAIVAPYLSFK
ncbi:hypothetical protein CCR75_004497 [Bremia lactucae]|uniref:Glycoside hydrolase family 5 C-terminal domain-containing protein n=1 Tax=Bremia lactucae TaxID=4779 RepID=A0A976IDE7_BRELC|nr:hypothetical protein CCR75_004497 [Bremia lactucae]